MKKINLYFNSCQKLAMKVVNNLKKTGIKGTADKVIKMAPNAVNYVATTAHVSELSENEDEWKDFVAWLDNEKYDFIDIFHVPMGWDTPLFQRFQHLSLQAGNIGGIAIYGAHPLVDDIEIYKFENSKLCLVNLDNYSVKQKMFEILDKYDCFKYIRLQSIDLATTIEELESYISRGYKIVYEYIDEITPQITGSIPEFVFKRHEYLLNNLDVTIIATSDKLYNQVTPYRNVNLEMINNGVDYNHWIINKDDYACPVELIEMVKTDKIVVGYHGALAQWIDYDLLKKIASDGRFVLLLIGHAHDQHMEKSGLLQMDNVYYIGAKPYKELNLYAAYYDIAILPFVLNDITKSVSPVKIFEYMALKKPIVTYSLPECQKYASCLLADTQEEFLQQLNIAVDLRFDKKYMQILEQEALANTWQAIAKRTVELAKGERF